MVRVFIHGEIELKRDGEAPFKVNEHRVKYYIGSMEDLKACDNLILGKV